MAKSNRYIYINGKLIENINPITYNPYSEAVMIEEAPRRTVWHNQVVIYRITAYRNVLDGFEVYSN